MLDKLNLDGLKELIEQPLAKQILFFEEMLTPSLLRLVYWVALVAVLWEGLGKMFSHGLGGFVEGIVFIVLGGLIVRVASELVMLLFQLNENMEKVAVNTKPAATSTSKKKTTKKVTKKA
ncbi:MAG: DUF4282 domain-containing protein [Pseudomonadota bacterium]